MDKVFSKFTKYLSKILIIVIITLVVLILLKKDSEFKKTFYSNIYENNISFTSINKWYQEKFGSPIPFSDFLDNSLKPVFDEQITYTKASKYKDGVCLNVSKNYLVPALESGMVIFIGKKNGFKDIVIIEGDDGVDIWYSNIGNLNVKMYDYVNKGGLLGEALSDKIYMLFEKDGKFEDYKKYLP